MASPKIRDQKTAVWVGIALLSAGAYCIYDAYDARGARRPFWLHFAPGL
jgi:hypothetical protein